MNRTPKRAMKKPDKVEIGFLEALLKRCPSDRQILEALGDLYTRVGRFDEGLEIDRQLVQIRPEDSRTWYNLGCSLALLGQSTEAFVVLRKAIALGYDDLDWMKKDPDLKSLRKDTRFQELFHMAAARL